MKISNIEVDFDFLDADNVEKFEKEAQKVVENSEKLKKKKMSMSEALRAECRIVEDFIDNVFGDGKPASISYEIFNGKMNLKEHIEIFQEIVNEKNKAQDDLQKLYNKYAPKQGK